MKRQAMGQLPSKTIHFIHNQHLSP